MSTLYGQVDKQGQPKIFHAFRVAMKGKTEEEQVVGMLHDVVEDGIWKEGQTLASIREYLLSHFGKTITSAVIALTRIEDESYKAYIISLASNPLARAVKLNDLEDNTDPKRGPIELSLSTRYAWAKSFLLGSIAKEK
jgi:(p)ppGpp synthase/HD superfamily hydrolase